MKKHKQPPGFEPGIYFDLSNDAYHKDSAFSHSGMITIFESPLDYWEKGPLNLMRPKPPTVTNMKSEAMKLGIWTEELLLEEEKFHRKWKKAGTPPYKDTRIGLTGNEWKAVNKSVEMIRSVPEANQYFSDGFPQVSIFVIEPSTGIRLRIRVDYLRPFGGIDYKRIRHIHGSQLGWAINDQGYDIQDALYRWVIKEAKRLLRAGKIKAHGPHDPAWLKRFMDSDQALFTFCFQRSSPPYPFVIREIDEEVLSDSRGMIEDAIHIYKHHIEKYGAKEWPAGRVIEEPIGRHHLPKRFYDRGVHQL